MEPSQRSKVIAGGLVLAALIAVVAWLVYSQLVVQPSTDVVSTAHPQTYASQSCTSCKAPKHNYTHQTPYQGECVLCHGLRSWNIVSYAHMEPDFDLGLHAVVGCSRCHTEGQPNPSPQCEGCHSEKSPHKIPLLSCAQCHTPISWSLPRAIPDTHLSLEGGHSDLSCFDCHDVVRAADARPRMCVDCHGIAHGGLTNCESCHDPARGWRPREGFDHGAFFTLEGAHATVKCIDCHQNGVFKGTSSDCVDCHGTFHGGLTKCNLCHTPVTGWNALPGFDHSVFYPLVGEHRYASCGGCHPGDRFAGTPTTCSSCHAIEHTGLKSCQNCHTPYGFVPSSFNHSSYFRITGAHTRLDCSACHPGGRYNGTPTSCTGCHGTAHGGLSACQNCHTTSSFRPSTFQHWTVFDLTGAHAEAPCSSCHPDNKYNYSIGGGGTACSDCHDGPHGSDYQRCSTCHTTTSWSPIKPISHPGYIDLGTEHASRSCRLCHTSLVFSAPTRACEACHLVDVPHVGPTDCLRCHRPTTWAELHFTHPELGIHADNNVNQQCLWCHPGPDFTKWDCKVCHEEGGIPME